ncbi:hypothetical protein [Microbacterium sp. CJ88]|uniref:hypothetical protein n=1 Tax=Microbacterium sp. CJ88 TaxID=3445672 RepID=UPI003F65EBCC
MTSLTRPRFAVERRLWAICAIVIGASVVQMSRYLSAVRTFEAEPRVDAGGQG